MHPFCKCGTLLALVLWPASAAAQFVPAAPGAAGQPAPSFTSASAGFVPPVAPAYPGFYPGYYSYFDPYGGYFRGVGDLITSYGRYYNDFNQARLLNQSVEQEKIRTRRMLIEQHRYEQSLLPTAEEVRARQREIDLRRAMNDPPLPEIISGAALNVLLRNIQDIQKTGTFGPTVPLDEDLLRRINLVGPFGGNIAVFKDEKLRWPFALRDTPFDEYRKKFQELATEATKQISTADGLEPATLRGMRQALDGLEQALRKNAADLELNQIVEARRYLSELRDGLRALQDPSVGNYFSRKWSARGNDVREL